MTGREHKAEQIVTDVIVERGGQIALGALLPSRDLVTELLVLALEQLAPTQGVDGPMLRGRHEPGTRVVRDARLRPPLERGDQRVLREILRQADVTRHPRESRDHLGRLDPPDGLDRAVGIGRRHRLRSFCAMRALTSFRTGVVGRGFSTVKRMVPLDVWYGASAFL